MNKYIGKMQVVGEIEERNGKRGFTGQTYVKLSKGFELHRYDEKTLVLQCPSPKMYFSRLKAFTEAGIKFSDAVEFTNGGDLVFQEKDLPKIFKVKVGTQNAISKPRGKNNIPWNDKRYLEEPIE